MCIVGHPNEKLETGISRKYKISISENNSIHHLVINTWYSSLIIFLFRKNPPIINKNLLFLVGDLFRNFRHILEIMRCHSRQCINRKIGKFTFSSKFSTFLSRIPESDVTSNAFLLRKSFCKNVNQIVTLQNFQLNRSFCELHLTLPLMSWKNMFCF